jgi:hypothetical protein
MAPPARFQFPCLFHLFLLSKTWRLLHFSRVLQVEGLDAYLSGAGLRLKAKASPLSPERALEIARRIQYHQVALHQRQSASGLSTITPRQKDLFETVVLTEPSARRL